MIFDNRRISEITPQELIDLIGNQEENLWIDFKQQDYHRDSEDIEKYKREICKDVTAMANAEGGYILIGIREENKMAQDFFTVDNAASIAQSINDICLQHIAPRIPNLEVEPCSLRWQNQDIELVIIHIPPSGMRPHSFIWKNSTNFVKRYEDVIREFPVPELIPDLLVRYQPPFMDSIIGQMGQIESQLTSILRGTRRERMNSISSEDNALDVDEASELIRIMGLRFNETISDQPYYRIFALPKELDPDAVSTQDEHIRNTMYNPPNRRYGSFGVTGILEREVSFSREGIQGPNVTGGTIILLKNGYFEVQCPINRQFQRGQGSKQFAIPDCIKWLYPYVVCEFPVTFLKLVKAIYNVSGIDSMVCIQQEYHNLTGFRLPGGAPTDLVFGLYLDETDEYNSSSPIISERTVEPDFIPDHVAYELVKEVYEYFGLETQRIPAFDESGNFILE